MSKLFQLNLAKIWFSPHNFVLLYGIFLYFRRNTDYSEERRKEGRISQILHQILHHKYLVKITLYTDVLRKKEKFLSDFNMDDAKLFFCETIFPPKKLNIQSFSMLLHLMVQNLFLLKIGFLYWRPCYICLRFVIAVFVELLACVNFLWFLDPLNFENHYINNIQ